MTSSVGQIKSSDFLQWPRYYQWPSDEPTKMLALQFATKNVCFPYNTNTCNFEKFNISENCGVTRTGEFTSTAESHILLNKDNKANYLLHGYFKEYKAVDWQGTNQSDIQKYMQSIIVSYQLSNVTTILLYNPPVFVWCENLS